MLSSMITERIEQGIVEESKPELKNHCHRNRRGAHTKQVTTGMFHSTTTSPPSPVNTLFSSEVYRLKT